MMGERCEDWLTLELVDDAELDLDPGLPNEPVIVW